MALQGDVRSLNLASVLQDLTANEKTGSLTLSEKGRTLHLWMENGVIRMVGLGTGLGPSIAVGLVATGKVPAEDLPADVGATPEPKLLKKLVKKHGIEDADITRALANQMSEHALETFLWGEARYDFIDGEPDPAQFDVTHRKLGSALSTDNLIMEAMRRQDEWEPTRRAILLSGEILVADPSLVPEKADPVTRRVFDAFDGRRTVRDVLELTRLGPFTVYTAVAGLRRSGAVRPMEPNDALETARTLSRKGDPEAALGLIEYGLEREPNNNELRKLAASCHEALANRTSAIGHYRQLAASHIEEERPEEAIATYRKMLSLSPGDLYAHERFFDLLLSLGRDDDAMAAAEGFALAARKAGLPDKARDAYTRLIGAFGEDEARLTVLADLQRNLGEAEGAIQIYTRLIHRAVKKSDDEVALDRCDIVLQLDPGRKDILAIKERLVSGAARRHRAQRRLRRLLGAVLTILIVVGAIGVYEVIARIEISQVRPAIVEATADQRHRDALLLYDELEAAWPWSLAVRELAPDREKVEEIHVEGALERSSAAEEAGDMLAAIAAADDAAAFARRPDLALRATRRAGELGEKRAVAEGRFTEGIRKLAAELRAGTAPRAAEKLAELDDPFAVAGLRERLADGDRDVRLAVVASLGRIEGDDALDSLVEALADPEEQVRTRAARHLVRRTGQDYGEDRVAWDRWLRQSGPTDATLIHLVLVAERVAISAGEPAYVEWRVVNIDATATAEIDLPDPIGGLRVVDGDGEARPFVRPELIAAEGEEAPTLLRRRARLAPGEFIGGRVNLRLLCPDIAQPGLYRIVWAPRIVVGGADRAWARASGVVITTAEAGEGGAPVRGP